MPNPEIVDRVLRTCEYRCRTIECPHKKKLADVIAVKWQISDDHWTQWTIVDCSLLPAGEVWCDMDCLALIESPPN